MRTVGEGRSFQVNARKVKKKKTESFLTSRLPQSGNGSGNPGVAPRKLPTGEAPTPGPQAAVTPAGPGLRAPPALAARPGPALAARGPGRRSRPAGLSPSSCSSRPRSRTPARWHRVPRLSRSLRSRSPEPSSEDVLTGPRGGGSGRGLPALHSVPAPPRLPRSPLPGTPGCCPAAAHSHFR